MSVLHWMDRVPDDKTITLSAKDAAKVYEAFYEARSEAPIIFHDGQQEAVDTFWHLIQQSLKPKRR